EKERLSLGLDEHAIQVCGECPRLEQVEVERVEVDEVELEKLRGGKVPVGDEGAGVLLLGGFVEASQETLDRPAAVEPRDEGRDLVANHVPEYDVRIVPQA